MTSSSLRCPMCGGDRIITNKDPNAPKGVQLPESISHRAACSECGYAGQRKAFEGLSANYDHEIPNQRWRDFTVKETGE